MRNYEVARKIFSFLEVIGWIVVCVGVIVGFVLADGAGRYATGGQQFLLFLAGLSVSLVGLVFVGGVQAGRATVDSAEYGQQMLKIAREQLEVSRQGLSQGKASVKGFSALKQASEEKPIASFTSANAEAAPKKPKPAVLTDQSENAPAPTTDDLVRGLEDGILPYAGKEIEVKNGKFIFAEKAFYKLEGAQEYIDQLDPDLGAVLDGGKC